MANFEADEEKEKKPLHSESEDILRNVYEKCEYESVHGLLAPLELYQERTLYYTGVGNTLLDRVLGEKIDHNQLDLFDRAIVSDALKTLYLKKASFSFNDIYQIIKDKVKFSDLNHFCRVLRQFGYKPVNSLNYGQIIVEDLKLTFERFRFLNKLLKLREAGKTIYYIDERIISLDKTFEKPWIKYDDLSKIDGYIFFHIVSKNGFEKGLFLNQANPEDFSKWISDIVLSFLRASSVIIMDNNPLHGGALNKLICRYDSKSEMIKWLQDRNIPCSPNMRKANLYELISRCPIKDNPNKIDLIFKSHGHEVLRLPKNYHDLSLTELLWEQIRVSSFTADDTANILNLKNKVYTDITKIGIDKWVQLESVIQNTEKTIFANDEEIEEALDSFKFNMN